MNSSKFIFGEGQKIIGLVLLMASASQKSTTGLEVEMSRERELLERAYHVLGELSYVILKESGEYKLAGDIYEYLADINQSETINNTEVDRSEPVAYLYDLDAYCDHRPERDVLAKKIPKGIPSEYLKNVRPPIS